MLRFIFLAFITLCVISMLLPGISSCKKETTYVNNITDTFCPTNCNIKGTYTGTSTASTGATSIGTYNLLDNNFVTGSEPASGGVPVTFGGYRNTCDSVIMSVYF